MSDRNPAGGLYLALAVVGFAVPNYFVLQESLASGNVMLWTDIGATFRTSFASPITSAFVSDLMLACAVFFVWMIPEARRLQMRHWWVYLVLTMAFGLAFSMPLFLYFRTRQADRLARA